MRSVSYRATTHAHTDTGRTQNRCYQRKWKKTNAHTRTDEMLVLTRGGHDDDDCSTARRRPTRNKSNGKSSRSVTTPRRSATSCVHVSTFSSRSDRSRRRRLVPVIMIIIITRSWRIPATAVGCSNTAAAAAAADATEHKTSSHFTRWSSSRR